MVYRALRLFVLVGLIGCGGGQQEPVKVLVPSQPSASAIASTPPPVATSSDAGVAGAGAGVAVGVGAGGIAPSSVVITQLSTSDPVCGLDAEGKVWRWSTGEMESDAPSIRGAKLIACTFSHSCVVTSDGNAMCWGGNSYGALGNGNEKATEEPTRVVGLTSVVDLSVDFDRTCARTSNGDVFCWGDSEFGKAGDGRLPDNVGREKVAPGKSILSGASSLSIASVHGCSIMSADGRVSCWGQNGNAVCGQPLRTRYVARPQFVPKLKDIASVRAGGAQTCIIDRQGEVSCWGSNDNGALGPNGGPMDTSSIRDTPVKVPLAGKAVELSIGSSGHVCARLENGSIHCWGNNDRGELGDGTTKSRSKPAPVTLSGKALRVGAGLNTTCALIEGGKVFCWGHEVLRKDASSRLDDSSTPIEMKKPSPSSLDHHHRVKR